jgi:hypothetical protein
LLDVDIVTACCGNQIQLSPEVTEEFIIISQRSGQGHIEQDSLSVAIRDLS